jgi:NADH-quinone oxidoreductase subunit A
MPELVGYLLLFLVVGAGFILIHLLVGKLVRPGTKQDDEEKLTIYECGEPTIGSAWVQFDVRFYVVALLFVIFDVEVAFFFPWAVVFGSLTKLAQPALTEEQRVAAAWEVFPNAKAEQAVLQAREREFKEKEPAKAAAVARELSALEASVVQAAKDTQQPAHHMAWLAMLDLAVFFGVLLVGFAYLWRRGDLQWVRSTAAEQTPATVS